jgi:hypothetical protein
MTAGRRAKVPRGGAGDAPMPGERIAIVVDVTKKSASSSSSIASASPRLPFALRDRFSCLSSRAMNFAVESAGEY